MLRKHISRNIRYNIWRNITFYCVVVVVVVDIITIIVCPTSTGIWHAGQDKHKGRTYSDAVQAPRNPAVPTAQQKDGVRLRHGLCAQLRLHGRLRQQKADCSRQQSFGECDRSDTLFTRLFSVLFLSLHLVCRSSPPASCLCIIHCLLLLVYHSTPPTSCLCIVHRILLLVHRSSLPVFAFCPSSCSSLSSF